MIRSSIVVRRPVDAVFGEIEGAAAQALTEARFRNAFNILEGFEGGDDPVQVGLDNGAQSEVLSGLKADDLVVLHPDQQLKDGVPVRARLAEKDKPASR